MTRRQRVITRLPLWLLCVLVIIDDNYTRYSRWVCPNEWRPYGYRARRHLRHRRRRHGQVTVGEILARSVHALPLRDQLLVMSATS